MQEPTGKKNPCLHPKQANSDENGTAKRMGDDLQNAQSNLILAKLDKRRKTARFPSVSVKEK